MEEVGQIVNAIDSDNRGDRRNAVTFASGAGAVKGARVVPGVMGTVEKVLNNLVGGSNV